MLKIGYKQIVIAPVHITALLVALLTIVIVIAIVLVIVLLFVIVLIVLVVGTANKVLLILTCLINIFLIGAKNEV
jgi:hypothetical protein